jgi:hypothetical protein
MSPLKKLSTCSICLDEIKLSEKIHLDCCHHDFHLKCLWKWQCIKENCPLCRQTEKKTKYKFVNDFLLGIKLMMVLKD